MMETKILEPTHETLTYAVELLKSGNIIAFPTETVYGLGANIFDASAIKKIFDVKQRPYDNPLIAHIAEIENVSIIADHIPSIFYKLASHFFPGPLSLVVQKKPNIPDIATAGHQTITVRMPAKPIARQLIQMLGSPIVAPSANLSGRPSPTKADHVLADLNGKIPIIIDGGPCEIGIESTILDITQDPPVILRPGHITKKHLESIVGQIEDASQDHNTDFPKAPGLKYRHYAPTTPITLFHTFENLLASISINKNKKILLLTNETIPSLPEYVERYKLDEQSLFEQFRRSEKEQFDSIYIFVKDYSEDQAGLMNRIQKAIQG